MGRSALETQSPVPSTAQEALGSAVARVPDRIALVGDGMRMTFRELVRQSDNLASGLLAAGLKPGDTALFQMGTVPDTVVALFGCIKAGILPVCTLPQHRAHEIRAISAITRPRLHVVQADYPSSFDLVQFAREMRNEIETLAHTLVVHGSGKTEVSDRSEELDFSRLTETPRNPAIDSIRPKPDDVLMLQLSGGSTGLPKVIPRRHGEYLAYAAAWSQLLDLGPDDVHLWSLPLIHNAAMIYHLFPAIIGGRKLVLMPRFDAREFFTLIEKEGVTYSGSIGPVASGILAYDRIADHDISSLRFLTTLSGADRIEAHVGVPVMNAYGITEGLLTCARPGAEREARHTTIGIPASPGDEIRLLDPSEQEVPLGEIGELCFRGPSRFAAYMGDPEQMSGKLTSDGFFKTGDLMRAHMIDGELHYSFEGRLKDNIDRGGEKFGTEDIEVLINQHPAVADSKVVAMPDPQYGEKACAYLIGVRGAVLPDVKELGAFLSARGLATFKRPERIEAIDVFPTTRVGKLDRQALRDMIASKLRQEQG
jgi:non-ribosomal peptide synthetase component E (peptide arylation enzyme)